MFNVMKKVLLFLILLTAGRFFSSAQTDSISSVNEETKTVFAQILGVNKNVLGIGNKISVEIDFGLEKNFWGNDGRDMLVDENGKDLKFNSMVDAMNFMAERGWQYVDSYVITINNQHVIHWLLSKEIPFDADSRDGFIQKRDTKKKEKIKPSKTDDAIYF